jgi:MFS family permease
VLGTLLVILSLQGIHYWYITGTWNRVRHIFIALYGWSQNETIRYEGLIGMSPFLGITVGRVIGSQEVSNGRYKCIMLGSVIISAGIGIQLVANIWMFLIGRVCCAFGMGFLFPAASRYIEECPPPQLLSLFYTLYSFGFSLALPLLALASQILPTEAEVATSHPDPYSWRIFLAIPLILCTLFLVGMLLVVKLETPTYLVSQGRKEEAMKSLKRFIHHKEDPQVVFDYLVKHTSKETNLITYREAIANQDHRRVILILFLLLLFACFTGAYSLIAYGSLIFEQMYNKKSWVDTEKTLNLMAICDPVS